MKEVLTLANPADSVGYAWVVKDEELHFAEKVFGENGWERGDTPLTRLVQGVFEKYHDLAFFRLRQKIYVNYRPLPFEISMVKLAAKRVQFVEEGTPPKHESFAVTPYRELVHQPQLTHENFERFTCLSEAAEFLRTASRGINLGDKLHDCERPIAALLLSAQLDVLGFAKAANRLNKTKHAELQLLQQWLMTKGCPTSTKGSILLSSLQPCRMCADFWHHTIFQRDSTSKLMYLEMDKGPKVRGSVPHVGKLMQHLAFVEGSK